MFELIVLLGSAPMAVDPPSGDALSAIDYISKAGVIAILACVVWVLLYLVILKGQLRPLREFRALEATHARELTEIHVRLDAVVADRDAWKLAAGNALEGLHAFERSTTATLEEKSMVIALVETIQQIANNKGGDRL